MSISRNHKYHYIYKTTCLLTGRYYIGMHSTSNLNDGYLGSGRRLWLSINKHGKSNHSIEIIEWLTDRSSLKLREQEIVNESLLSDPMCMNLQIGGGGGFTNVEHQLKCSKAGGLTNNPTKSKMASDRMNAENQKRLSEGSHKSWNDNYSWKGKLHKDDSKLKIGLANSVNQTGERNSQFGTRWVYHPDTGPIKINQSEVEQYVAAGYVVGRKIPNK